MADTIQFRCKNCEKKIAVRAEYAGKKAKCPGCKQPLRVPTPRPKRSATGVPVAVGAASGDSSAGGESSISLAALAEMEERAPVELRELTPKVSRQSDAPRIAGGKDCPDCNASVKPDAVICVHCGHNFESGKRLKTKKESKVGKAIASVKDAATRDGGQSAGPGYTLWSVVAGAVFCVLGIAMALFNFRPESDPDADTASIIEVVLLFLYDSVGAMLSGAITFFIGLCLLGHGFKILRRII